MVLKRDDFETRKYVCERCGQPKVRKRIGSTRTPRFCPDCRLIVRKTQLKKAREKKEKGEVPENIVTVAAPDGSPVRLTNDEEKEYYEKRKKEYLKDFDWTSADLGLFARLLNLEVQCRRFENQKKKSFEWETKTYLDSIKEIQKLQDNLGILRLRRDKKKEERTPLDIVQNLIKRFNDYRDKNLDRFVWLCSKCGEKNYLKRENPNLPKEEVDTKIVEESGATPTEENDLKPNDINEKTLRWQQREGVTES